MTLQPQQWIDAYADAWRGKDSEAITRLFTPDARYQSSPFLPPSMGHQGIKDYWKQATASQEEFSLAFGRPFVDGDRVIVEWWATMREAGWAAAEGQTDDRVTLPGCLILRFDEQGLCEELREYWHVEFGPWRQPPEGWGR